MRGLTQERPYSVQFGDKTGEYFDGATYCQSEAIEIACQLAGKGYPCVRVVRVWNNQTVWQSGKAVEE